MKSFGERWDEIVKDPVKLKKTFNVVWIIAYSMLILGFILMVWVLFSTR